MEGKFPYTKLIKYPHLRPEEVRIWEAFIDKYPDFFDSVDYDIHVGTAREYPEVPMEEVKRGLEELSRKRIDVVGYKNKHVFIGEIKPSASLNAIGQLLGELELWKKEHPKLKKVSAFLVTDQVVPDMPELTKRFKIGYYVG